MDPNSALREHLRRGDNAFIDTEATRAMRDAGNLKKSSVSEALKHTEVWIGSVR